MIRARNGLFIYALLSSFGRASTISSDTLFFLSKGLTFASISSLEIFLAAAAMALELPSGVIADRYGRKTALLISCGARAIAYLFVITSPSYGSFATAFLFFGAGVAFQSGAINAWLVDAQKADGTHVPEGKSAIQRQLATLSTVSSIGNAAGAVAGGFAFAIGPSLPWRVSLFVFLIAAVVLLITSEPRRYTTAERSIRRRSMYHQMQQFAGHIREAAALYLSRPILIWITAYACVSQIGMTGVIKIWQPWFASLLGDDGQSLLGVVWMCFVMSNMLANRAVSDSFHSHDSRRLLLASAISGLPLVGFAFSTSLLLALPLYMLHVFGEAYKDPILYGILHDQVDDNKRATIESFYSLTTSFAEALGFLVMGFAIDRWGMQIVVCLCATFFVSSGLFASKKIDEKVNQRGANSKSVEDATGA